MESGNPKSSLPNSKISSCLNLKSLKYNPFFLLKEIILFDDFDAKNFSKFSYFFTVTNGQ